MKNNETNIGYRLMTNLLGHPGTVVVIGEDGQIRLVFADELEPAHP